MVTGFATIRALLFPAAFLAMGCVRHTRRETTAARPPDKLPTSDFIKECDVYKFENDSLVQLAYVHYLKPTKIEFSLVSSNKKDGKTCALSDTATLTITGDNWDPSTYEDELKGDELYPVYEFDHGEVGGKHTYIGIEPSRGKRLSVQTALSEKCGSSCPLTSVGTLRRIRFSKVKQEGPHLPPVPK
jgi:hypothetical protein